MVEGHGNEVTEERFCTAVQEGMVEVCGTLISVVSLAHA